MKRRLSPVRISRLMVGSICSRCFFEIETLVLAGVLEHFCLEMPADYRVSDMVRRFFRIRQTIKV
jgi:hypothetical protein